MNEAQAEHQMAEARHTTMMKKVGPYKTNINSRDWLTRLQEQVTRLNVSWDHLLTNARFFFLESPDEEVREWFTTQEAQFIEDRRRAITNDEMGDVWHDFSREFTQQFDPLAIATAAEQQF